ncbi:MAG TPA: patatin-like phospholipase family protein, partial [Acidimicrobiales bacterium]|nr:patatin-like phospholipase family protein [Acidimicrobiales bacterium]
MGVGLVLGGGGAVGHAFHAGVLSALAERTGFDPRRAEVIVGTSARSIVCALLRAGVSADELRDGTVSGAFGADIRSRFEKARRRSAARAAEIPRRRAARLAFGSPGILTDVALRPWRIRPGA